MRKEFPKRTYENRTSFWKTMCECGHEAFGHSGVFTIGQCDKCTCPKFKEDEDYNG